jgi:glucosyl-dolichyl phosphate glucuronosyltransferase
MEITVCICTWNRCELLRQALEQIAKLSLPGGVRWELLVVNNNSRDATDAIVDSFAGRLPVKRLFEPRQGKSYALNLAVQEARGDYILLTDDDALVDTEWLRSYRDAFERWPNAAVFGGPVEPCFEGTPPHWLEQAWAKIACAYATRDWGDKEVRLHSERVPFGINMAVRRDAQTRYLYDTSLGPRPGISLRGEDTAMVRAMLAAGLEGRWVPGAKVRHYIPRARQTTRYLREFFFGQGERYGRQLTDSDGAILFGKPRWLWRQALESEMKYRIRRLFSAPAIWAEDLRVASEAWGQMRGCGFRSSKTEKDRGGDHFHSSLDNN